MSPRSSKSPRLTISELSHTVINALSFRVEYRRGSGGTAMFQRQVRFQIDLSDVSNTHSPRDYLFAIIFTLHSGNIRRFRRVCEHIQTQMCARKAPPSPRATRKFNTDLSESSSCGSDTSERLSPYVNIRNGKYRMVFEKAYPCQSTNSIQYNVYFSKKTSNITEMKGNFTYLIPLDDTLTLEINAASRSLMGGWKPNSMVYISKHACSSLKIFLGNVWNSIVKSFNIHNNSCLGTYISTGINVKELEDHNFPKVYYYGKYKVLYKIKNVENKLLGCLAFELNLIRPWEKPN
ncbi:hypothetical protein ACI65C_004436 [Semiaphis heraclei]